MIQDTPITKLESDVQDYQSLLVHAKIELKHAQDSGATLRESRIKYRIEYFENRLSVSKSELSRFKTLYNMNNADQLSARLISSNKFGVENANY